MHVTELSQNELSELKDSLYYEVDGEEKTKEQQAEINNAEYPDDISNELVFELFNHYDFVEDDFWCNLH